MFQLGRVVITTGAAVVLDNGESEVLLNRHLSGDWGYVQGVDKCMNEFAVEDGDRIVSRYRTCQGFDILVITEAENIQGERPKTTILLPQELR